jgi:hypothetical protein
VVGVPRQGSGRALALCAVLATLVACSKPTASSVTSYLATAGGPAFEAIWSASALPDGGVVVTGAFVGTAAFGSTTLTSAGGSDVFVARLGPNGDWLWATRAGGAGSDEGFGVSVLPDGGAMVTGIVAGAAAFGATTLSGLGSDDIFVARIDADGAWLWATEAGGSDADDAAAVSVTDDGGAFITGWIVGTAAFGTTSLTSGGAEDAFVARIDATGAWVWATRAGGIAVAGGRAVSATPDGGAVVAGIFAGTSTFGPATLVSAGAFDAFVAKVSPAGAWSWASRAGGPGGDAARGIVALPDGGAVVVGGFQGTVAFAGHVAVATGDNDAFVAHVDGNGAWGWVSSAGGTASTHVSAVDLRPDGGLVVAGSFAGTTTIGATTMTSAGGHDALLATLDAGGRWLWAASGGGGSMDAAHAVAALPSGAGVMAGSVGELATFGLTQHAGYGNLDVFVAKVGADGSW